MTDRIKQIASPTNPLIKGLKSLHMKKRRDETGLFLAEGGRVVIEALDCGAVPETMVYAQEERSTRFISVLRDRVIAAGGNAIEVTSEILEKLSRKDNPQNVLGVFRQKTSALSEIAPQSNSSWLALDGVRDPGNLGSIIRTADAAGAGGVILVGATCDPFSMEAVRATMGSIFAVKIFRSSVPEFIAMCGEWPGVVIGAALQTETDYRAVRYERPTLLVMGAEQAGISPEIRAACSCLVKIPMRGRADSLNLAISTGIMLYRIVDDQSL